MRVSGLYAKSDLPISRYQELAKKLYTPLLYGENSSLLFFPTNGMSYDVNNLWVREEDRVATLGSIRNRFRFAYIHLVNPDTFGNRIWLEQFQAAMGFDEKGIVGIDDFEDQLKQSVKEGKEPTFFIHIPASLSDETLRLFFEFASKILFIAPSRIHMLLCMEMRWTHEQFTNLTNTFHTLFQHTSIVSAPRNEEVYHLLKHYIEVWNYPLAERVVEHIVHESGGSFLFAKYVLRLIVSEKCKTVQDIDRLIWVHPYIKQRIDYFLSTLPKGHLTLLHNIANGQSVEKNAEVSLLIDLDIVRRNGNGYTIRSPIVAYACIDKNAQLDVVYVLEKSDGFSKREKVILRALLDAKGSLVSRQTIAEIIWEKNDAEQSSDWVIDQTMRRIRNKLSGRSDFHSIRVQTHKKKGFSVSIII